MAQLQMDGRTGAGSHCSRWIGALAGLAASAATLAAPRVTTEHGIDFVTVGSPGNRNMRTQERYYNNNPTPQTEKVGRVNYRYRVGKTEVTASQYLQFVRAFGEHWENLGGHRGESRFTGGYFTSTTLNPNVNADYVFIGGFTGPQVYGNKPITIDWRVAAYFCNYLHNGAPVIGDVNKETIPWEIFASGAYDVSAFNPPGPLVPAERLPGAKFWIPDLHEWTKAAYYDPERYADGNPPPYNGAIPNQDGTGGYWLYPHMSQNEPIIGQPWEGGEVGGYDPDNGLPLDVGSYPHLPTPWGALDMMGSVREWTETPSPSLDGTFSGIHMTRGSDNGLLLDRNDHFFSGNSFGTASGIRLAARIPAPSTMAIAAASAAWLAGRRRRLQ